MQVDTRCQPGTADTTTVKAQSIYFAMLPHLCAVSRPRLMEKLECRQPSPADGKQRS